MVEVTEGGREGGREGGKGGREEREGGRRGRRGGREGEGKERESKILAMAHNPHTYAINAASDRNFLCSSTSDPFRRV